MQRQQNQKHQKTLHPSLGRTEHKFRQPLFFDKPKKKLRRDNPAEQLVQMLRQLDLLEVAQEAVEALQGTSSALITRANLTHLALFFMFISSTLLPLALAASSRSSEYDVWGRRPFPYPDCADPSSMNFNSSYEALCKLVFKGLVTDVYSHGFNGTKCQYDFECGSPTDSNPSLLFKHIRLTTRNSFSVGFDGRRLTEYEFWPYKTKPTPIPLMGIKPK